MKFWAFEADSYCNILGSTEHILTRIDKKQKNLFPIVKVADVLQLLMEFEYRIMGCNNAGSPASSELRCSLFVPSQISVLWFLAGR